eukprot:1152787-Pelagomonas_calceolata.AAC.3
MGVGGAVTGTATTGWHMADGGGGAGVAAAGSSDLHQRLQWGQHAHRWGACGCHGFQGLQLGQHEGLIWSSLPRLSACGRTGRTGRRSRAHL